MNHFLDNCKRLQKNGKKRATKGQKMPILAKSAIFLNTRLCDVGALIGPQFHAKFRKNP